MKKKIYLYDTYTKKTREFIPLSEDEVDIYYCGPTVYNYVHLGNFRPTVTFDLLTRFLTEIGYEVKCVSNYTDIDDKIIKEAQKEHKTEKELSSFYINAYEDCLNKLNILPLYNHPKASEYIDKMADFIQAMIDNNTAYKTKDDIYFRVSKIEDYGVLSNQKIDDLEAGKRIDVNSQKENPLDFALWKLTDDDGIKFDTILGRGRPGWHTECVVMVNNVFHKPLIDIHGGGFDLKFPHHENEIAQSEAINHTHLANYWMHVGFLLTNGIKMSKSLGNSILAKDVLERFSGNAVRLFFLSTHYRAPINYTEENLQQAEKQFSRYYQTINKAVHQLELHELTPQNLRQSDYDEFMDALAHDLNVSNSLAVIDRMTKELNSLLMKKEKDYAQISSLCFTYQKLLNILGFKLDISHLTETDKEMFALYQDARNRKDYETSDKYRSHLIELGII